MMDWADGELPRSRFDAFLNPYSFDIIMQHSYFPYTSLKIHRIELFGL